METDLNYRKDIDGLRGVAVVLVMLFHSGIQIFSGGFIGVDVFFVISGFLICSIILREIEDGTFSFSRFYERRARRILPALFVVSFFTCYISYKFLLAPEFLRFGHSLIAMLFSFSNFYFWSQTQYFDPTMEYKPLLHTWSLAIEEQFYFILPISLFFFRKKLKSNGFKIFFILILILGLLLSIAMTKYDQDSAFYLLPSRFWELLLGASLAFGYLPELRKRYWEEVISFTGISIIMLCLIGYSKGLEFPGLWSIPPCIGALFVIWGNQNNRTVLSRMLSVRPIVFIGLISYSLYLWHWPLHVIQIVSVNGFILDSKNIGRLFFFLLPFPPAFLTWKYVERNYRNDEKLSRKWVTISLTAMCAVLAFLGGVIWHFEGFPNRFPDQVSKLSAYLDYTSDKVISRGPTCFLSAKLQFDDFDIDDCLGAQNGKKNFLLLGDSYAAHLWYGLSEAYPDINFLQATTPGCRPWNRAKDKYGKTQRCSKLMNFIFEEYLKKNKIEGVLLAGRWQNGDEGHLSAAVDLLKKIGLKVILFGPIIEYDASLPRLLAQEIASKRSGFIQEHQITDGYKMDNDLAEFARKKNIQYVSILNALCKENNCQTTNTEGVPVQFDYGHLTGEGSKLLFKALSEKGLTLSTP